MLSVASQARPLDTIPPEGRRFDIDWLRVIAMLAVFVFHCTRFFDTEDWHVKAAASEQTALLAPARGFLLWVWLMELFFLVSGFATWHSLSRRSAGRFLLQRAKRLLIPLYAVGLLALVVPQDYLDRVTHGGDPGPFWRWLPTYYCGLPGRLYSSVHLLDPASWVPFAFTGHLWFIRMLFVISLLTLPVLLFLRSSCGRRVNDFLAEWADRPGGIFVFVILLTTVRVTLFYPHAFSTYAWGDFLWYALYFVIGFILASDARFAAAIGRQGWNCLALWISGFFGVAGVLSALGYSPSLRGTEFSTLFVIWQMAWSLVSWSAVIFMLSLAAKHLRFTNSLLVYSNEAVLPFYLLHQTIILLVGWFVLPWHIKGVVKFLIIAVASLSLTLTLYELSVRRNALARYLFGMAPRERLRESVAVSGEPGAAPNGGPAAPVENSSAAEGPPSVS